MNATVRLVATCLAAIACAPCLAQAAQAPSIMVQTRLEPATVAVGEAATLHVDTYTTEFFTSGIALPPLHIPGAIVKMSEGRATHINTQISGQNWFGIAHSYVITPIVADDLTVPSFEVSAAVGASRAQATAKTRQVTLRVSVPEGAGDTFVTHDLQVKQKTDMDLSSLKVGDSFTRTIEVSAAGTPAMFIPELDFGDIKGLKAYPQAPQLTDSAPDDPVRGTRTSSVTYVVVEPGRYTLPAIEIQWWDLDAKAVKTSSAPELTAHAVAAAKKPPPFSIPSEGDPQPAIARAVNWRALLTGAGVVAFVLLAVYLLRPPAVRLWHGWREWRHERHERHLASEQYAFHRLERAVHSRQAQQVPAALYQWLDTLPRPAGTAATTLVGAADDAFARACRSLLDDQYGTAAPPGAAALHDLTASLRHARRRLLHHPSDHRTVSLPLLNP